jgi:hypothetical protein
MAAGGDAQHASTSGAPTTRDERHEDGTRQRLAGTLLATGLLTAGLFTATSMTNPGTAQARRTGAGNQIIGDYWTNG